MKGGGPRLVLLVLASYMSSAGDKVYRKEQTLAAAAGLSVEAWRSNAKLLVDAGVLTRERRIRDDGSQGTWEYRPVRLCPTLGSDLRGVEPDVVGGVEPDLPGGVEPDTQVGLLPTAEVSIEVPTELPIEVSVSFDDFWKLYPRREGKAKARERWGKLKPHEQEAALAALPIHLLHQPDPTYFQHAPTWLNQKRWEDDLDPAGPPKPLPEKLRDLSHRTGGSARGKETLKLLMGGATVPALDPADTKEVTNGN